MKFNRFATAMIALAALVLAGSAKAIVQGQIDDFEDGTTQNWANGGAAPQPVNITTGGPGGLDDNFMEITSDGSGAGGRLVAFNRDQWLGDYIGQGVNAIEMDLQNLGAVTLSIRLGFKLDSSFGAPGYLSAPIILAAGSGWQHVQFSITSASLIAIDDPGAFNTFFSNGFGEVRFLNEAGASNLTGDPVTGALGVDNIHAVPEPAVALLGAVGLLGLAAVRRRKRS